MRLLQCQALVRSKSGVATSPLLPLLHQNYMHSSISNDDEGAREDGKTDDISGKSEVVEAESAQYRSSWNLNVKTILMVDECEECTLIDNERLESIVEYGELQQC